MIKVTQLGSTIRTTLQHILHPQSSTTEHWVEALFQIQDNMTTILKNWHFMRLFRAAIAIWAISEAWRSSEWLLLFPGGIFAMQAFFDIGCCGASGCTPNPSKDVKQAAVEEISYEEVR